MIYGDTKEQIGPRGAQRLNAAVGVDYFQSKLTVEQAAYLLGQEQAVRDWPEDAVTNFVTWLAEAQPQYGTLPGDKL